MFTPDSPRDEAVAWLVGRLRFEHLLADLRDGEQNDVVDVPAAKAA